MKAGDHVISYTSQSLLAPNLSSPVRPAVELKLKGLTSYTGEFNRWESYIRMRICETDGGANGNSEL